MKRRMFCTLSVGGFDFSPEGIWEPERWFRSFDTSRGNSPLTVGDKKRPPELDKEHLNRRRPSGRQFCLYSHFVHPREYVGQSLI